MIKKYKNFLIFFSSLLITLIFLELFLGYYFFQKQYTEPSALWFVLNDKISRYKGSNIDSGSYIETYDESNPFITFREDKGYKFHPFIDYSGAFSYTKNFTMDYFGFRNKENLYFDFDRNYTLIILTGGSEAMGFTHEIAIAENLEKILNEKTGKKFRVLAFAMNSYTISNEINAYVNLAYHLKPEFVITHTGYNDMLYGLLVPYNFKKLGLNYNHFTLFWLPRLYNLIGYSGYRGYAINKKGHELIVDNFLLNLKKYEDIVSSNDGELLVGIQGYNKDYVNDGLIYKEVDLLYRELTDKSASKGYTDFTKNKKIKYVDMVHSDENSSKLTAEEYAKKIIDKLKNNSK